MGTSDLWRSNRYGGSAPEVPRKPTADIIKEPSYVEVVDNRIYFYSDVSSEQVLQLNRRLRETSNQLMHEAKIQDRDPANIFLHVHSYGGSLLAGFAAMDEVVRCQAPVTSIVDGAVASAATFITVSAEHRIMRPHAHILIHQLSSMWWGKYSELKDEMKNLDRFMEMIKDVYGQYTKVPPEKLDEILEHDLWFDSDQALRMGIVDEIR